MKISSLSSLSPSGRVRLSPSPLPLRFGLLWHEDEDSDGFAARCSTSAGQTNGRAVYEGRHVEHTRASPGRSWQQRVSWTSLTRLFVKWINWNFIMFRRTATIITWFRRMVATRATGLAITAHTSTAATCKPAKFVRCHEVKFEGIQNGRNWKLEKFSRWTSQ